MRIKLINKFGEFITDEYPTMSLDSFIEDVVLSKSKFQKFTHGSKVYYLPSKLVKNSIIIMEVKNPLGEYEP